MPRSIADSDDDVDEIFLDAPSRGSGGAEGSSQVHGAGAVNGIDGTNEQSTGSTERLRRQIVSAERGLISQRPGMDLEIAASSPSTQANKRRHTAAFGSDTNVTASSVKRTKRTKTVKTYDSKARSHLEEESAAAGLQTSQSARFSDHSGLHSSLALPALPSGSLQIDFLNHEPNVMFRDSGSTIPDGSLTQRQLLEQAVLSKKGAASSVAKALDGDGVAGTEQGSSSVGWTQLQDSLKVQSQVQDRDGATIEGMLNDEHAFEQTNDQVDGPDSQSGRQYQSPQQRDHGPLVKPHPSPAVYIHVEQDLNSTPSKAASDNTNTTKSRKKKAVENNSSEPLNSDDKLVGLPKELYKPRPSRRRATGLAEETVDFSVAPEKAAKVKRTKTIQAVSRAIAEEGGVSITFDKTPIDLPMPKKPIASKDDEGSEMLDAVPDNQPSQSEETIKHPINKTGDNESAQESQHTTEVSDDVKKDRTDEIFVKPTKPTPKTKASKKAKRSQTTIFEDHVTFLASRLSSPSLSQQQANRKTALVDLENEATPIKKKGRVESVGDDEDTEDALAKDSEQDEDDLPPKKRCRGRPAKAAAKSQPKSAEIVQEDSDDAGESAKAAELPKKKGRGRPSKAAAVVHDEADAISEQADEDLPEALEPDKPQQKSSVPSIERSQTLAVEKTAPSSGAVSAQKIPTPSPEKPKEQPAPTPPDIKANPTTHSPIKGNSKVPLRVGLSKKRRIPPLLKVVKPSKK